jgi:hypothetical protein
MQEEWGKAEELIEPYRNAIYLLSDDTLTIEFDITGFKLNLYGAMGDRSKIKEIFIGHREFLVQYAKDNHQDLDEQIEKMDALIKNAEDQ